MMEDAFQKWCIEALPIVQAGIAGQVVQHSACGVWSEKTGAGLGSNMSLYRIAPGLKYRPFTLEESGVLMAGKVWHEDYGWATVECVTKSGLANVLYASGGISSIDLATMLGRFTFVDTGKPCGVLVEGEE